MRRSPLRICLLGLGRAGSFHLQSLRQIDDARLTCVYDTDAARATAVAQRFDCVAASSGAAAIERPDVDAVIVATPTDSHYGYVQHSLAVGKPVLTEKPLGRHLEQIDACFATAAAARLPLLVAFQRRFDPSFAELVRQVHAGDVGQLQFVRSVSRDNPVPSAEYISISGGIFHDCMVHDLDMVCHIVGEVPSHVSAFGSSFIEPIGALDDFDNVVGMLTFPGGVVATIDINRKSAYGYDQRLEAFGSAGMLLAENRHQNTVAHAFERGFLRAPVDFSFPTRYREAYQAELACFVACVRDEQPVPISHGEVRTNHRLASALQRAARERRVVAMEAEKGSGLV